MQGLFILSNVRQVMGKTWAKLDRSHELHFMPAVDTDSNQLSLALAK
jgi:hypothetical protein